VALVNMPFAPATRPSIQIGILKALLEGAGVTSTEHHASVDFYDRLRARRALSQYTPLSPSMVSEWYFSERPFDPRADGPDREAVERLVSHGRSVGFSFERMLDLRQNIVAPFLDDVAAQIAATGPRIACFSLSYAQINASFAIARRLRALIPGIVTIFGGAGSQVHEEACREYMRAFSAVDYMVLGEAEFAFAEMVKRLLDGRTDLDDLPDLMLRRGGEIHRTAAPPAPLALDESPIPMYDGYFELRARMPMETRRELEPVLLMELGRGCTWGDERTCKFCAFIFHGKYRSKSRERVIEETRVLTRRHRRKSLYLVDDIVTNSQIADILPAMKTAVPGLLIQFMEMRTATTRRHVQALADSGVCLVQPGTENFDDGLLKKISKGTTAFHNIQFLKWARESGVRVSHNVLLNIPGATRAEIETQLAVIEKLVHLDPPFAFPLQLVRFSPYHAWPEKNGIGRLLADPFYRYVFPEGVDISKVAYEFIEEGVDDAHAALHFQTAEAVGQWQMRWGFLPLPFLVYERDGSELSIIDGRGRGPAVQHRFDALAADVHATITDCPMNEEGIVRALAAAHPGLEAATVARILDEFVARDLALRLRGRCLSLAVDAEATRRWLPIPKREAALA
jgi:ribosomal peptide maturation radical SAM protein 1